MKVAFLWHMHQPCYIDPKGLIFMPWVFLHAVKDYYDMPYLAREFGAKVTFNLTPTLIQQLDLYAKKGIQIDRTLRLFFKKDLLHNERLWLFKLLKSPNYKSMVEPIPRYRQLYRQSSYTSEEFEELKVAFLLAWSGNFLRQNDQTVKTLLQKERYEPNDLEALLASLENFVSKILPFYKDLYHQGAIELSTTPYAHPILPLLLDMQAAKEANPLATLPKNPLSLQEDAKRHIQEAIALFKAHFGKAPQGMWPAEGSVSEAAALLFQEAGIEWIATDEAILKKSGETDHHKGYRFKDLALFFRDHTLSDLIGFTYKQLPASQAIEDFRSRLNEGLNAVILDGENAWEYYPDNGIDFLSRLYQATAPDCVTFNEAAVQTTAYLERLAPGSWIGGDFATWVGDPQKNRAWEILYQTKRDFLRHPKKDRLIDRHFLLAEASDWFWWYGKGHFTLFNEEFDTLFRSHLIAIYHRLGHPVPLDLQLPITAQSDTDSLITLPQNPIHPVIDGRVTSFFEWLGSGYLQEQGGAMERSSQIVQRLYWGEDDQNLYIRLDGSGFGGISIEIFLDESKVPFTFAAQKIIEIALKKPPKKFVELRIELYKKGKIVQIIPSTARVVIELNRDYDSNWFV